MIKNSSIWEEAKISVIIDDVDGCDWIFVVLFTDSHYLFAADVVAVEVDTGTVSEKCLITAERLEILTVCGQHPHIHPPDKVTQVQNNRIASVRPVLIQMFLNVCPNWQETAFSRQRYRSRFEQFHAERLVVVSHRL